ncbi:MAG: ADP-ribosylglycohydrolase family protein, partial [Candidatus Bathyarchaeia archaeon]
MLDLEEKKAFLPYEAIQCFEEGKEIDEEEIEKLKEASKLIKSEEEADRLYDELLRKKLRKDWNYSEPSELVDIEKLVKPQSLKDRLNRASLRNKISGAWMGRIVGNMLGKPVEFW